MKLNSRTPSACDVADLAIAAGLAIASCWALGATACPYADPGAAGRNVSVAAGLYPGFDLQAPLWRALAGWVASWPDSNVAARVHRLNAVLLSAAAAILYLVMRASVYTTCRSRSRFRVHAVIAGRIAGTVAALATVTSLPIWWAGTRAHNQAVGVLLVLAAGGMLIAYLRGTRAWQICLLALLCGMAAVEWTAAIFTLPFFAGAAVIRTVTSRRKPWLVLVAAAACGVIGLLLYPLTASQFAASEAGQLRGMTSTGMAVLTMWREQYRALRFVTRETGWLITLLTTVLPAILALGFARDALSQIKSDAYQQRSRAWSFPLLHVAMTVVSAAVLANTRVAPWTAQHGASRFLLPAILTSIVFGYTAAYWYLLPSAWWPNSTDPRKRLVRVGLGPTIALFMLGSSVVFAGRTLSRLDRRSCEWMRAYAHGVLDSLNGQTWIATSGFADDALRLAAAERKFPVVILNIRESRHPVYRRYVTSLMERAQRRNAAELGVDILVREMIRLEADAPLRMAITATPQLWQAGGLLPIPRGLVFTGADREPSRRILEDLCDLAARIRAEALPPSADLVSAMTPREERVHMAIMQRAQLTDRYLERLARAMGAEDLADSVHSRIPRAPSKPDAKTASSRRTGLPGMYLSARELAPEPGSDVPGKEALLLMRRATQASRMADAVVAEALLAQAEAAGVPKFHTELERAVMYARLDDAESALEHARAAVEDNGEFIPAWVVLAGIHELRGDRDGMLEALDALELRHAPAPFIATVRARLALCDGDAVAAARQIDLALSGRPNDPHLLEQQIRIRLSLGQTDVVEELAIQLLRVNPDNALGHHVRGRQQVREGELALAEQSLRRSIEADATPQALNDLAWVLCRRDKAAEAATYASRAVALAPQMAHAWHTLGVAQQAAGNATAARDAFRKCLDIAPQHEDARRQLDDLGAATAPDDG